MCVYEHRGKMRALRGVPDAPRCGGPDLAACVVCIKAYKVKSFFR